MTVLRSSVFFLWCAGNTILTCDGYLKEFHFAASVQQYHDRFKTNDTICKKINNVKNNYMVAIVLIFELIYGLNSFNQTQSTFFFTKRRFLHRLAAA